MLLGVLEVSEQRLGLVGRADLQVLAHRQRIDRREKDRVAHDAGDRMDDQLVSTGNADHGSATRVRAVLGASAPAAAAAARRGGDGLGHLLGAPAMSVAAMFVIFVAAVTMPTATLSMPMAMLSVPVATVAMSVTSMAAMAFSTVSVPAATAAALGGGDIRVYQLKLLPISHVSSFNPATRARSLG